MKPYVMPTKSKVEIFDLGKTDEQFYDHPADGRAIMDNDRRIMASGQTEVVEEMVSTPAGPRYYLGTKAPHRDANGNIIVEADAESHVWSFTCNASG